MKPVRLPAQLYRQFDADPDRAVPGEGYGGWQTVEAELAPQHTALVVMHAWDSGQPHEFPGWRRAVEYMPRAEQILREVFPGLLAAVRRSPLRVFHVVGGDKDYWSHLPGYQQAVQLAGDTPQPPLVPSDAVLERMKRLRAEQGCPGKHNAAQARPVGGEGIAKDGAQLAALCRAQGVNHLVYAGFALNWCLLMSPGGMVDMARHGCLCSTIAEATTAVENAATAREQREKQQALWRVAVEFGFVFALDDFVGALPRISP
jgi:nicotinamidase-related amidase